MRTVTFGRSLSGCSNSAEGLLANELAEGLNELVVAVSTTEGRHARARDEDRASEPGTGDGEHLRTVTVKAPTGERRRRFFVRPTPTARVDPSQLSFVMHEVPRADPDTVRSSQGANCDDRRDRKLARERHGSERGLPVLPPSPPNLTRRAQVRFFFSLRRGRSSTSSTCSTSHAVSVAPSSSTTRRRYRAFVNEHKTGSTRLYADAEAFTFVAVINDATAEGGSGQIIEPS